MSEINTGGGAAINGKAAVGGDLIGRDQNTIFLTVINQFGDEAKKLIEDEVVSDALVAQWQAVDPLTAEKRYRQNLINHYNRIRILGTSSDVSLQDIFTDVYIYEEPMARIPYEYEALRQQIVTEGRYTLHRHSHKRINGLSLVNQGNSLFIVGKPGAGKTTFLKYVTIQAANYNLNRLPIFISLNEWANSSYSRGDNPQIFPFIVYQFEVCQFEKANLFVEQLLRSGSAIVLFDGLDEVRQEDDQRRKLTQLLKLFAQQYDQSQHVITCRLATNDYAFPGFRDVEMADFSDMQVQEYSKLWFQTSGKSHVLFEKELAKEENAGVREICSSPLLLSMVCLYFERVMRFPPSRAELYEDAIEALLTKWDASRDIVRDEIPYDATIYRELSPRRKKQLFAEIAARTFEVGDYVFRRRNLVGWIYDYLIRLPNVTSKDDIDSDLTLRAIEAQHGIFVERAKDIYAFSHLTFHEYFTARYIFDHERRGATTRLFQYHLADNRWREVFLLTVSLFDREGADDFFKEMRYHINKLITDNSLHYLLRWVYSRISQKKLFVQLDAEYIAHIFLERVIALADANTPDSVLDYTLDLLFTRARGFDYALIHVMNRILDTALDLTYVYDFSPNHHRILDTALTYSFDIIEGDMQRRIRALVIPLQIKIDYELFLAWSYAEFFAKKWWPRENITIQKGMGSYPQLIENLIVLLGIDKWMDNLTLPSVTSTSDEWKQFADKLYKILQIRDLVHGWHYTKEEITRLDNYFYANELLVQCLNVAVVSDRQAILAGLLAPPKID